MEDHELELLISDLPNRKWGSERKIKQKQMLVNMALLERIRALEQATKPRKRGRPRKLQ